jgi:hypothetical protein|tara:strand:+ start:367 stop:1641 length:1275 start_codon:yes stop_codon:yes gene_type:complete
MSIKLKGSTDGSVNLQAPADTSPTGSDITLTLPTSAGSANQFVKNAGTAGELEYSSMVETSSGIELANNTGLLIENTGGTARRVVHIDTDNNLYLNSSPEDNSIIFQSGGATEAARIDPDGRLLVNTTTNQDGYLVQVKDGDVSLTKLTSAAGGNDVDMLRFRVHNSANTSENASLGGISAETVSNWGGSLTFHTKPNNGSPNETVQERMRIDSSGRLIAGSTATWDASIGHQFRAVTGSGWALNANSTNTGSSNHLLVTTGRNSSGDNLILVETNHGALGGAGTTMRFKVNGDGNIYATNTTVQSASDERLKENIRDSEDGLAVINQLRPVRFDWRQDQTYNEGTNQLGFIAQEVEQAFPEAVGIAPLPSDFTGDDPQYKTVAPGAFIPVLVKALQEASAKIETLETQNADLLARVTALEAAE